MRSLLTARRTLLSLLFVAALSLSGCIGTAAASAMEAQSPANEAARQWKPEAELNGVMGMEGTLHMEWMAAMMMQMAEPASDSSSTPPHFDEAEKDKRVGDGRSMVWAYRYIAPDTPGFFVVIEQDENVVYTKYINDDDQKGRSLGQWVIDSHEALRIAKEHNEGLREGVKGEQFGIMEKLERVETQEHATWIVAGGGAGPSGAGGGMVEIDAVNGAVLQNEGGFYRMPSSPGAA